MHSAGPDNTDLEERDTVLKMLGHKYANIHTTINLGSTKYSHNGYNQCGFPRRLLGISLNGSGDPF